MGMGELSPRPVTSGPLFVVLKTEGSLLHPPVSVDIP